MARVVNHRCAGRQSARIAGTLQEFTGDRHATGSFREGDPPTEVQRKLAMLIYEIVWAEKFQGLGRDDELARTLGSVVDSVCATLRQEAYDGIAAFLERKSFFAAMPHAAPAGGADTAVSEPAETLTERLRTCLKQPKQAPSPGAG
ncbi:hypothetical protein [Paracoccus aminovorans]|uniref:hypothetical protein n=1 Tax=Paracoccus aminovorans TaxID=34004 RepID=UPI0011AE4E4C|nr:hypothetical protein [Paracoccus aminovorans]